MDGWWSSGARADLERCLADGGPVGVLIGVQGGQVLEGSLDNVARLREHGVRMFAPAHVMDNALVGSSTGRSATGLTAFGREALAALEEQSIDRRPGAHVAAGVEDLMAVLSGRSMLSHTGLTDIAHGRLALAALLRGEPQHSGVRWRARSANMGVWWESRCRRSCSAARRWTRRLAPSRWRSSPPARIGVALGSDMDGALKMVVDVEGLPALAGALLDAGLPRSVGRRRDGPERVTSG